MPGLYRTISAAITTLWDSGWSHSDVPVFWRANDAEVLPDPSDHSYFLRNEVDFGRETVRAFGGGRMSNERAQFGSVVMRVFAARSVGDEDTALDLMADAMQIFRSVRSGDLSFIGEGSGFDEGPDESGLWFIRGSLMVFEYHFLG
jgi:hypothetical protein